MKTVEFVFAINIVLFASIFSAMVKATTKNEKYKVLFDYLFKMLLGAGVAMLILGDILIY